MQKCLQTKCENQFHATAQIASRTQSLRKNPRYATILFLSNNTLWIFIGFSDKDLQFGECCLQQWCHNEGPGTMLCEIGLQTCYKCTVNVLSVNINSTFNQDSAPEYLAKGRVSTANNQQTISANSLRYKLRWSLLWNYLNAVIRSSLE